MFETKNCFRLALSICIFLNYNGRNKAIAVSIANLRPLTQQRGASRDLESIQFNSILFPLNVVTKFIYKQLLMNGIK